MAHMTDQELADLKSRVISAMGTGANVARANDHLLALINEVQELRGKKSGKMVLKVGEMEVKKAEPAPAPPPAFTADDSKDEEPAAEDKADESKSGKKSGKKK